MKTFKTLLFSLVMFLFASPAFAQQGSYSFVWPEIGIGGGSFLLDANTAVAQIDFSFGVEREGYPWSPGAMFRLDIFASDGGIGQVDIGPLFSSSSTFEPFAPFFRMGAGPMLTFRDQALGVSGLGELAIGFKSIAELFLDGRATLNDSSQIDLGVTAGIRLNTAIWEALGDFARIANGGSSYKSSKKRGYRSY